MDRIIEGFDTADLMEAKALLDELSLPRRLQACAWSYVSLWLRLLKNSELRRLFGFRYCYERTF